MAEYITVRVTALAGRRAICVEKDARHPGGEARVRRVGTEHEVGETPNILQAIHNGELAVVSTTYEGETAELAIPRGIWTSAGLRPVKGAHQLKDLPTDTLEKISRSGGHSKVQREFIAASKLAVEERVAAAREEKATAHKDIVAD